MIHMVHEGGRIPRFYQASIIEGLRRSSAKVVLDFYKSLYKRAPYIVTEYFSEEMPFDGHEPPREYIDEVDELTKML